MDQYYNYCSLDKGTANGIRKIISFIRLLVYEMYYKLEVFALSFLFCYAYRALFIWFSALFYVKVSRVFFLLVLMFGARRSALFIWLIALLL